jgi:hypothetical protein
VEVVYFSRSWLNKVHPPESEAFLAKDPLSLVLLISEVLWKLLIGMSSSLFSKSALISIGFKPCSKGGAMISTSLKNSLKIMVGVECNNMMIFEVDLEANNIWDLFMGDKMKETPNGIRWRDVMSIDPTFDLNFLPKFQSTTVKTFMNIFEGIFECSESDCTFNVNVAVKFNAEKRWKWHNPTVINHPSIDLISFSIIWPKI